MTARSVLALVSIFCSLALVNSHAFAQRGGYGGGMGGHGGGMGGPGGGYGGMHPGTQPGGAYGGSSTPQNERAGPRPGTDHAIRSDRPESGRTPGELLQQNTKLSDNLAKLLPAGTDLQKASAGFGNLGEFVAAVHVSRNLGIPFDDLKQRMTQGDSLGEAIRALRPEADAQVEARKARARADADVGSS